MVSLASSLQQSLSLCGSKHAYKEGFLAADFRCSSGMDLPELSAFVSFVHSYPAEVRLSLARLNFSGQKAKEM